MIIRDKQSPFVLLFAWRGTILPKIIVPVMAIVLLSMGAWALSHYQIYSVTHVPQVGFMVFGVLLSIFLGFRNTACYDRWWEARKLWGALIACTRHLTRDSQILAQSDRHQLLMLMMSFVRLLRDRLRFKTAYPHSLTDGLDDQQVQQLTSHINAPQVVLAQMQAQLIDHLKQGAISDIVYFGLQNHVNELGAIQAGCDRIASTPLPFSYSVLLHRSVYIFCWMLPFGLESVMGVWTPFLVAVLAYMFLGLDELSSQLEDPFGVDMNDLPLDAMTRLIERETLVLIDEPLPDEVRANHNFNLL